MKKENIWIRAAKGAALSVLISVMLSALSALLITRELLPQSMMKTAPTVILAVAAAASCAVFASGAKTGKLLISLCIAGIYFAFAVLMKFTFFAGKFDLGLRNMMITAAASLLTAMLLSRRKKRDAASRPRKRR